MGNLFGKPVEELKFGIAPGSHVAHFLQDSEYGTELFLTEMKLLQSGIKEVTQEEIFTNGSEKQTKELFTELAKRADTDYKNIDRLVPEMSAVLFHLRDYLTASGRAQQQNNLRAFNTRCKSLMHKVNKRFTELQRVDEPSNEQRKEMERLAQSYASLHGYQTMLSKQLNGNLQVDWHETNIEEPKDVMLGRIGKWRKTEDVLFPHVPSPNDIKQGHSVFDCYVLSALSRMAESNPQKIMDMMKDNDDGTVSVRFFVKDKKGNNPKPVIITVNKTVNQDAFGHNNYASSSLWVQMIEKAYAKYNELYVAPTVREELAGKRKALEQADPADKETIKDIKAEIKGLEKELAHQEGGMDSIWVGSSHNFMNAIEPENYEQVAVPMLVGHKLYEQNEKGEFINHPNYYLPEEKQTYEILKEFINEKKQTVTAIPDRLPYLEFFGMNPQINGDPKDVTRDAGLRPGHIYGINKVFEQGNKLFVQIRDPYAMFSASYKDGKLVKDNHEITGTINAGTDNMGTVNLEIKDFLKYFQNFTCSSREMCKAVNDAIETSRNYIKYPPTAYEMQHELPQLHKYISENSKWLGNPRNMNNKVSSFPSELFTEEQMPPEGFLPQGAFDPMPERPQAEEVRQPANPNAPEPQPDINAVPQAELKEEPDIADASPQRYNAVSSARSDNSYRPDMMKESELKQAVESHSESVIENRHELNQELVLEQRAIDEANKQLRAFELNDALQSPEKLVALSAKLNQAAKDLSSTDEFFVLTNSKEFNSMRDSLYSLAKDVKKLSSGKASNTPETRRALADRMMELQQKSRDYLEYKQDRINQDSAKGKVSSDRALLRMAAAININSICALEEPLSAWPSKKDERLRIVEEDIKAQLQDADRLSPEKREYLEKALQEFHAVCDEANSRKASVSAEEEAQADAPAQQQGSSMYL